MLKAIRNVIFVLGAFFSWGIVGSVELERLTLSQGMGYIGFVFAVCAAFVIAEYSFRAAKILLTVYYIKRKRASRSAIRHPEYRMGGISPSKV
jgi:hypothetical protein